MYCLWPQLYELELQCTLFVATTMNWMYTCTVCGHYYEFTTVYSVCGHYSKLELQCTLFVVSTMNWMYMCTVSGHYYEFTTVYSVSGHYYKLEVHVYCLEAIETVPPSSLLVCRTIVFSTAAFLSVQ